MLMSSTVKVSILNPYLQIKVFTGLLNKASLISMGIVGGNLFRTQTVVGLVLSIVVLCIVAVEQCRSVVITYQCVMRQKPDM